MAKQTFVTGNVLTAAQMNTLQANDYNATVSTKIASYVLVAADVGTTIVQNVATANTVTVNTALFAAGDTLRIQNIGAGVATVTAGTATVNTAGSLALPQWGSGILYFTSASAAIFFPSAGAAGAATVGVACFQQNVAFSLIQSTTQVIPFISETFKTEASFHSTSVNTTRITIPTGRGGNYRVAGIYRVGGIGFNVATMHLLKNGSLLNAEGLDNGQMERKPNNAADSAPLNSQAIISLVAGDYIELGMTTSIATQSVPLFAQFNAILIP